MTTKTCVLTLALSQQLVSCRRLNARLRELAPRHKQLRFRVVDAASLDDESIDASSLPLLLVYRRGKLADSVFSAHRVLGDSFEARDVEILLAATGALRIDAIEERD